MHLNNVGSLWLRRYAVFVAVCTFGLVIAGGLVTSNDAALSIPDWPLSWGHLVPTLEGGIRYEFAHRVTAMLVGLLTVGLAVWMGQASADAGADPLVRGRRPRRPAAVMQEPGSSSEAQVQGDPRGPGGLPYSIRLAWAAVAVVLAQAALGGVAVRFLTPAWATIAHASLGQLFFAMMVAICVGLFAGFDGAHGPSLICAAALFAQTILGAAVRYGVVAPVAHIVGALLATILVMWAGLSILMRHMDNPKLRRPAMLLLSITFSQVFLGIGALMARVAYADAPQPMPMVVWFTVAHVAVGSLALGAAVALAMLARPDAFQVHGGMVTA
jgi:cytochrome c oxidase assembly protein subunit 15